MKTTTASTGERRAMVSGTARAIAVGLAVLGLTGCVVGEDSTWEDEAIGEAELAGGPIGHNDISPEVLRLELAAGVTPTKLCIGTSNPAGCEVTGAWDTWQNQNYKLERGQLLDAMVRCAMDPNYDVYVPGYGGGHFKGMFGLLPQWKTNTLTTAQQEILSGCVLALINANGSSWDIGIIGPFSPAPPDPSGFIYMEAVFYGNIFWPGPAYIACGGIQEDGGYRVPGRNQRICGAAGNPCRIDAIGSCSGPYAPGQTGYCIQWSGSGDGKYCAVARDDGSKQWKYPSTVYLKAEPLIVIGPINNRCGTGSGYCQPEY